MYFRHHLGAAFKFLEGKSCLYDLEKEKSDRTLQEVCLMTSRQASHLEWLRENHALGLLHVLHLPLSHLDNVRQFCWWIQFLIIKGLVSRMYLSVWPRVRVGLSLFYKLFKVFHMMQWEFREDRKFVHIPKGCTWKGPRVSFLICVEEKFFNTKQLDKQNV